MTDRKKGRPTDNPRTGTLLIRMSEPEKQMLDECTEALKTSKTAVVIKGIKLVHESLKKGP